MTGWGSAWLDAVVRLYPGAKGKIVTRGRAYLRSRRVVDVSMDGGSVRARVIGYRHAPYHASVTVRPIAADVWDTAIRLIAANDRCAASIRQGVLLHNIVALFDSAGETLIPRDAYAVSMKCSCHGRGETCEHMMALQLWIAAAIDSDPFVLFTLRGGRRDILLDAVEGRGDSMQIDLPDGSSTNPAHQLLGPEAAGAGFDCWRGPVMPLPDSHDTTTAPDQLIAQLGDPPGWDGELSMHEALAAVYRGAADGLALCCHCECKHVSQ